MYKRGGGGASGHVASRRRRHGDRGIFSKTLDEGARERYFGESGRGLLALVGGGLGQGRQGDGTLAVVVHDVVEVFVF